MKPGRPRKPNASRYPATQTYPAGRIRVKRKSCVIDPVLHEAVWKFKLRTGLDRQHILDTAVREYLQRNGEKIDA